MGRPSKKTERTGEILAAFQRCVIARGLDATTLDDVAREAGIQRAMIRHYVGNREWLIRSAVEGMIKRYRDNYDRRLSSDTLSLDELISFMFSMDYAQGTADDDRLLNALVSAATSDDQLRMLLGDFYAENQARIARWIVRDIPGVPLREAQDAAYVMITLAEQSAQFQWLGLAKRGHKAALQVARDMIQSLKSAHTA